MLFWDAIDVLVRRWYMVVTWAILMIAAAFAALVTVPTNYQASGQVLLLPPTKLAVQGQPVNPYLNLPGSLTFTATLVASTIVSPEVARDLVLDGYPSEYSVSVVPGTGPLIIISVEHDDQEVALALRDELLVRIEAQVDAIQDEEEVIDTQLIEARRFNVTEEAEVLAGNRLRALGGIAALGTLLAVLSISAAERRATRQRRNRSGDTPDPPRRRDASSGVDSNHGSPTAPEPVPSSVPRRRRRNPAADRPVDEPVPVRARQGS